MGRVPTIFVEVGQQYGQWTIVQDLGLVRGRHRWLCRCTCGVERTSWASAIVTAKRCRSCALRQEPRRKRAKWHSYMPEYQVWSGMRNRCKDLDDPHYGGRGIRVCERWIDSFASFMDDMGQRPSAKHSIDRINNDGNYEPGNCRWATPQEQMRNRSDSAFVEFNGKRLTMVEWAERLGVSQELLLWRIKTWGVERALSERGLLDRERWSKRRSTMLTDEDVADIRRLLQGGARGCDLALRFGMSRSTISLINVGRYGKGRDKNAIEELVVGVGARGAGGDGTGA